jgi:hypothetical protein
MGKSFEIHLITNKNIVKAFLGFGEEIGAGFNEESRRRSAHRSRVT